eukprot:CAMPEP_0196803252 /NCGR_PEP_ID=MMETSP1362-20130617/2615_1 /TAXON_ID=163516 /ORGANISM="Leptocylindrus danicus, Strain CCMP1856" /LENGTH=621 /DNA_ID=CAMNT_0042174709 /DNA_START=115 /DNA_END=1980 /DNA_ORIENTATION=+
MECKVDMAVPSPRILFLHYLLLSCFCFAPGYGGNWIDPDTPEENRKTTTYVEALDGAEFELVMSDEFNVPGRTFKDGEDPKWTALQKNDYTNAALQFYDNDYIYTDDEGNLIVETAAKDTEIIGFDDVNREYTHITKHFKSGMLQSWNKFCFTGGIIETEVLLPGKWNVGGLWPAFWLLGNLGRHTYVGSTDGVWPWSLTECKEEYKLAQLFSGCNNATHFGFKPGVGRGSPEVDIFEVQPGPIKADTGPFKYTWIGEPFLSASYQIAPGKSWNRPGPGFWPGPGQWYEDIKQGWNTSINIGYYGNWNFVEGETGPSKRDYWSDAVSWNHQLQATHFETFHKYRLEWGLPSGKPRNNTMNGYDSGFLNWYVDDKLILSMKGESFYNMTGGTTPTEPMYVLINTALSRNWGFPIPCPDGCDCMKFNCNSKRQDNLCGFPPGFCEMMLNENPKYKMNYVRVYQNKNDEQHKVGCSIPERPTRKYIEGHPYLYKTEDDEKPLKDIQKGGGACDPDANATYVDAKTCGGLTRGTCSTDKKKKSSCTCESEWTGPNCLAKEGSDPYDWDPPETISDVGYYGPVQASPFYLILLSAITFTIVAVCWNRGNVKKTKYGWKKIPNGVIS